MNVASVTLAVSGLTQLVAGVAYVVVARRLASRRVEGDARLASRAFVAWWGALGAYMLLWGTLTLSAAFGYASLGLLLGLRVVSVPLLMASLGGLTYHVLYLFTGRRGLFVPVAAFYALGGLAYFALTFLEPPAEVRVGAWTVEPTRPGGTPLLNRLYVALGLPPILASLAYGALYARVREPMQKYRVALVAGSLFLWVGSGLAARVAAGDFAKFFTLTVMGLAAALAVVLAYYPPPGLRLRLDPLDVDAWSARHRKRKEAEERRAEMEERCRALV